MAGILLLGATQYPFSGGLSQFNPNTYGEQMFIDLFKHGQGWGYIDPTASGYDLDSDGWPRAIPGGVATTNLIRIPETYERAWTSGCYKVTWKDAGTIRLTGLTVVSNGPGVTSGIVSGQYEAVSTTTGSFYVTVTPTTSSPQIGIKAVGASSYIKDVHFYYTTDEAEFLAGRILSARARQVISDLGFGVMRHMNWGANTGANFSSVTTWDTRRRRSNAFWLYPTDYRSDFYVGTTSCSVVGSTYTYTIAGGSGGPTPMETIHVKWDQTLLNPELGNVAELVYKGQTNRILNFRAQVPGVGQNGNSSGVPYLGSIYTLVYDAVLEAWLAFGASGSVTTNFIDNGIPPDVFIDICKEIGCHPWICPGYLSTAPEIMLDTAVSWPYNFDQLIQSSGPSWMEAFWEGCNEPWNNQFYWQKWAPARQLVYMGGRKPQDAVPTPYLGTAVTSAVAGAVVISMTGPLPAKGALVLINSESAPGLLQFDGTSGYVTASGAGSITLDSATIAGSFAGSSGATTITLANPGTITVPVSVTANQALKLTTTGTLPASIPADGVVYAKTTGTTVQISATNGGAALDLSADSQSGTHTVTVVIAMTLSEVAEPDYYGQIQSYLGQLIAQSRGVVKANVKTQMAYKMIIGIATRNFDFVSSTVNENVRATARSFVLTDAPIGSYAADPASEWTTAVAMANYLGVPTQLSSTVANSTALVRDFKGTQFTAGISSGVMTVASIDGPAGTATITLANPAVVSLPFAAKSGQPLIFTTTGTLPANIPASTPIYALSDGTSVQVSLTVGGAAISTSGNTQSGTHTSTFGISPGVTIFGPPGLAMADAITVSAYGTGGSTGVGRTGTYVISDNAISYPTGTTFYAGDVSSGALETALDSALGCTFDGQVTTVASVGELTVNTLPVGSAIYSGMIIRDGLVGINRAVSVTTFKTGTGGTGTYNLSSTALGTLSARAMSAQGPFSPSEIVNKGTLLKAWAIGYDINNAYCYEGNLTADPGTAAYNLFYYALRLCASSPGYAEGVKTMVKQNYDDLVALSGGGFTFAFPSCFQLDGRYPSNNNYSMMQSIYNDYSPQALAIQAFNA